MLVYFRLQNVDVSKIAEQSETLINEIIADSSNSRNEDITRRSSRLHEKQTVDYYTIRKRKSKNLHTESPLKRTRLDNTTSGNDSDSDTVNNEGSTGIIERYQYVSLEQARMKIKKFENSLRLAQNRERRLRKNIGKLNLIIKKKMKQR